MNQIKLKALAKINLGLDVLRKREDGYHEVKMVMQSVHLYDDISIRRIPESEIKVKTNLYFLPVNENNLVYKAAALLRDEFDIKDGVKIDLKKRIPVAAGLAGGSSDAAAVLFGMNRMFRLGLKEEELKARGVKLGADVPYCIMRATALAEGIGEKLTKLPPIPKCYILIAKPDISVSTKFVYENLHANELKEHVAIDQIIAGLEAGDLNTIAKNMGNVLETVTIPAYPVIDCLKQKMTEAGALNAMMSGSGPTVFGLFDKYSTAKKAYTYLKELKLAKVLFLTTAHYRR